MILELIPNYLRQNVCNYLPTFLSLSFYVKSYDAVTLLSLNVAFDSKEAGLIEKKTLSISIFSIV